MTTKITHLDNSGFLVETPDVFIVFDLYRDPAHDVTKALEREPEKPVVFFVTHSHPDHFNPEIFHLGQNHKRLYVLSNDISARPILDNMPIDWMSRGDEIENLPGGISAKAYGSTDAGVSYLVTLPGGRKLFHAGDLNFWHWADESSEREVHKAKEAFLVELDRIAEDVKVLDVAFFPVDVRLGAECAAGAELFLEKIEVRNFIPMHFKGDYEQACDFKHYKLAEAIIDRTRMICLHKPGESIELD